MSQFQRIYKFKMLMKMFQNTETDQLVSADFRFQIGTDTHITTAYNTTLVFYVIQYVCIRTFSFSFFLI